MGMVAPTYWTADMARALPDDGNRYEVVYGELLVTPAPRPWHEVLFERLMFELGAYLRREPIGIVLGSKADISWSPDVLVSIPGLRARARRARRPVRTPSRRARPLRARKPL
jgi:Uma2 family endonuclease